METLDKSKRRKRTVIFVSTFFVVATIAVRFVYANRCHVIECASTSWSVIRNIAISKTRDNLNIESIYAVPQYHTPLTDTGPVFIDIYIQYASSGWDKLPSSTNYPLRTIWFDDRTMIIHNRFDSSSTDHFPPENREKILEKVKVSPRDAIRVTWALAQNESSLDLRRALIMAGLAFDYPDSVNNPIWIVVYDTKVAYDVDAQTGQVIRKR